MASQTFLCTPFPSSLFFDFYVIAHWVSLIQPLILNSYPGRLTSKWDICACQAVAEAAGAVLTDKYGMRYSYEQGVSLLNESGTALFGRLIWAS